MTAVVWPAPQLPGTGGCLPCDWVPTGPVPSLLQATQAPTAYFYDCATNFGCTVYGCGTVGSIIYANDSVRWALKFVGGSYDSTKKYSDGLSGCTDTLTGLTWLNAHSFTYDIWAAYRAGLWTGMVQILIYSRYAIQSTGLTCTTGCSAPGNGCSLVGSGFNSGITTVSGGAGATSTNDDGLDTGSDTTSCPWGDASSLLKTLTIYDDGTYTLT